MKTEKFIVEIEMPDGDSASSSWLKEILQSDADIEDEGRWRVSVKKRWKPSEEQIEALGYVLANSNNRVFNDKDNVLIELFEQLKAL